MSLEAMDGGTPFDTLFFDVSAQNQITDNEKGDYFAISKNYSPAKNGIHQAKYLEVRY